MGNITKEPYDLNSQEFHHNYKPNVKFITQPTINDEFKQVLNIINSKGIRGPEIPEKRKDEYRILLIGDSFIQAHQIKYEDNIGQVLNRKLAISSNQKYRVIQHGMSSWSPLLELNWVNKIGLSLKPDMVILFLCINDFCRKEGYINADEGYATNTIFDKNGYPVRFDFPNSETIIQRRKGSRLIEKIQLVQLLIKVKEKLSKDDANFISAPINKKQITKLEMDYLLKVNSTILENELARIIPNEDGTDLALRDFIRLTRDEHLWDQKTKVNVTQSLDYVDKLLNLLKDKNIKLMVTMVPIGWNIAINENQIGRKYYRLANCNLPMGGIEKRIKAYCSKNNVKYIDIYQAFINYSQKNKEKLCLQSDGHWSSTGHRVAAERIYKEVIKGN